MMEKTFKDYFSRSIINEDGDDDGPEFHERRFFLDDYHVYVRNYRTIADNEFFGGLKEKEGYKEYYGNISLYGEEISLKRFPDVTFFCRNAQLVFHVYQPLDKDPKGVILTFGGIQGRPEVLAKTKQNEYFGTDNIGEEYKQFLISSFTNNAKKAIEKFFESRFVYNKGRVV